MANNTKIVQTISLTFISTMGSSSISRISKIVRLKSFLFLKKMGHSRPLFQYAVDSKQMFNKKVWSWPDSNRGLLVSKATILPTEPHNQILDWFQNVTNIWGLWWHSESGIDSITYFKWAIPGLFFIYVYDFKQTLKFLHQISVKMCIQFMVLGFEPTTLQDMSPPITTRPV